MKRRRRLSSRALAERVVRQQVKRDLKRGLTTGSRDYQEAMREAKALFDLAMAIDRELDVTRRLSGGVYALRADGSPRGVHTRFGQHECPRVA